MDIKRIVLEVEEYASQAELPARDQELLDQAILASHSSYSPYSSFRVGSAVRLGNGLVVSGNNQENAAYPSGLCAERVALFYAQAHHPDEPVDAIAIFANSLEFKLEKPVTPCGSCRQVIAEYEHRHDRKARIIMANGDGSVQVVNGAENLLPLMFYLEELKKH